jgi:hypothetical protein
MALLMEKDSRIFCNCFAKCFLEAVDISVSKDRL